MAKAASPPRTCNRFVFLMFVCQTLKSIFNGLQQGEQITDVAYDSDSLTLHDLYVLVHHAAWRSPRLLYEVSHYKKEIEMHLLCSVIFCAELMILPELSRLSCRSAGDSAVLTSVFTFSSATCCSKDEFIPHGAHWRL